MTNDLLTTLVEALMQADEALDTKRNMPAARAAIGEALEATTRYLFRQAHAQREAQGRRMLEHQGVTQ